MKVKIFDTTLRDGEQTPGVSLTPHEKHRIALKLDDLGVDIIEAGSAITSPGERESIKLIVDEGLSAEIVSFARPLKQDIDAALECGVDTINLVIASSDIHIFDKLNKSYDEVIEGAVSSCEYAIDNGLKVELSAEDASRANMDFLKRIFSSTIDAGASRICPCDTVGMLTPDKSYAFFKELSEFKVPISTHCHNDFGLAVANTLSAISAGASTAHCTVNGIGERAGNASLEETVVSLAKLYDIGTNIDKSKLFSTSKLVSRLTGVYLQPNKAIVGENAFAHESGIHSDGVIKNTSTYEPLNPEFVGHKRKFVMGKHIGKHALKNTLNEIGLRVDDEQLLKIFTRVKSLGDMGKCVSDVDVQAIADDVLGLMEENIIDLDELNIVSGNKVTPTASVKLKFEDESIIEAGVGVGPVDAAIVAINKSLSNIADIKLEEYHVDAITGGTDALIDVIVKVSLDGKIVSARSTQPDIINASVEAYISGANKLLADRKKINNIGE